MYTIIIPTFNRHDLLLRAIDYYQHFNCDVFIADSSDNKFNHKLPDNIIYKHLPKSRPDQKIYEVAKNITTPYVNLVGDDDFLVESSLKSAAFFLDNNPDYVSAQGRFYKFELADNKVTFTSRYHLDSIHSIESEDRSTRIAEIFNPYMHQIYALTRIGVFVKHWKFFDSNQIQQVSKTYTWIPEITSSLVPMCYGKHKVFPVLWMVRDYYIFDSSRRQKHQAQIFKSKHSISHNYWHYTNQAKVVKTFLNSDEFLQLKKSFCENFSDLISSEESNILCNLAFKSHLNMFIRDRTQTIIKIFIKLFTPNWVLKYYAKNKKNQYASGIEDTILNDCFNKVRLSVLNFKKCYDNYR
jgi:glycosyltransferase domain-containing protein